VTLTGTPATIAATIFFAAVYGGALALRWRVGGRPPLRRALGWYAASVVCVILAFTLEGAAVTLFFLASVVLWIVALAAVRRVATA
jgi:hypothetical protein